jgi:hypothetical protein
MVNQPAKLVFAQNMQSVLGNTFLKELVRQANNAGIVMNYPYANTVRKGETNVSTDKCEDIVAMLRMLPGYDWIELWMFFVPGYFDRNKENVLDQSGFSQEYFDGFVNELLVTASRLQFLSITEKQFEQMTELSKYIYQKKHGLSVTEPAKLVDEVIARPGESTSIIDA